MSGLPIQDISELRSRAALVRFTCGCLTLCEQYVDRAYFTHRGKETHSVDACCHTGCSLKHRCGSTCIDGTGSHRGLCGPAGPEKPIEPVQAPTPDSPPAIRSQPVSTCQKCGYVLPCFCTKPVRKPAKPAPSPIDDSLDDGAWDGLLSGPQPVLARR